LEAFILIKLFSGKLKKFISIVNQFEEVQKSYRVTGNENVLMKVVLKNQKHLQAFLDKIMVFGDTTTSIILSEIVDSERQDS
jgi:Lrp/AsnC family leucine-responsive transcriptional regulator